MRIATTAVALVLALGLTAPAPAQPSSGPGGWYSHDLRELIDEMAGHLDAWGSRWRGHLAPQPGGLERPLISFMLRHREDLRLTPAQVAELERLRHDFEREGIRRDADIRVAEMDVAALLREDPVDLTRVEAKVREAERLRAELRVARIRVIEQGKGQLTAEQRGRLRDLLSGLEAAWARPERRTIPAPPGRPRSF
jgi:Spy/CpxP family protein refolding chaperone